MHEHEHEHEHKHKLKHVLPQVQAQAEAQAEARARAQASSTSTSTSTSTSPGHEHKHKKKELFRPYLKRIMCTKGSVGEVSADTIGRYINRYVGRALSPRCGLVFLHYHCLASWQTLFSPSIKTQTFIITIKMHETRGRILICTCILFFACLERSV